MNQPAEAGPSRPSPPRNPSPLLDTSSTDIVMEDVSTSTQVEGQGESDDAVALLLNISSAVDVPPKPDSLEVVMEDQDQSRLVEVEKPAPPDVHSYPYTPPEDTDTNDQPTVPPPLASASLSNILTSSHTDNSSPSASAHPPTPTRTSPDPPVKTKGKRKRNTTSGSSRRTSTDHPAHWLGEENTIIRCICGFTEDDGFTIQCENCGAWEHGICFGYVDAASAPEQYFCELCEPRPFDAAAAKQMQIMMQNQQRQSRIPPPSEGDIVPPEREKEKPRSKGGKTKRSRTESMMDGDLDKDKESGKEHSPGVMGPPASKPKRRQPGPKPRPKQNISESSSTPGPSTFKEQQQLPQPILEEPEDDYFRVEPWALEYTPIKENIVRGVVARQIIRNVYKEWVDAEEEMVAAKSRAVHNPSGLPSPTETGVLRLSPDNLFPPPDFHILAPPVPPIFLSGPDLESLGSPVSIQVVEDAPSFLPLTYTENISKHGVYTRPTIYSVFTEEPVTFGSFIGEYKGEITDCESYRKDPINQYSSLGLPKPHVRSIGPPINLMIDARGYGNDFRFVRSGCHPNVVLRPLLWRSTESDSLKLKFGLFASKDIGKKDELVLGWEWDDQHVVHSLRSIVHAAMLHDGSLASPGFSASPKTINSLSHKIDSVLTHIFGTFTACACVIPGTCALAQMGQLVEPKMMQDNLVHENGRKKLRVDLGELVGAVRGWRRRELENAEMKKWRLNEGQAFDLGLTRMSSRTSEAQSTAQSEDQQEPSSDKAGDESMEQDVEEGKALEDVQQAVQDQEEEAVIPEVKQQEGDDARMEVELPSAIVESPSAPTAELPAESEPVQKPTPNPALASSPTKSPFAETHINVQPVQQPSSPILKPISSPSAPRTPKVERQDSSSSLSSAISSIKPSLADDMDVDTGSESDATTATIPKTQSSESDAESDITSEEEQEKVLIHPSSKKNADSAMSSEEERSSPAKPKSGGNARKVRRVLSPIIESSKHVNGHHDLSEDEREMIINKPKKSKVQIPDSSPKTSTFQPLAMSDIKKVAASKGKRGRTKRIVSSSASEDDSDDEMRVHGKVLPKKRRKSKDSRSSPKSAKSIKLENLETIPHPHGTEDKEEPRAVVPDQVTAPLSSAMEMDEVAIPDPEVVPPVEVQPAFEPMVEEEQPRDPTPPPREPTPPPPEPPKKVSLSDYLKSHKFRKESQTPVNEVPPAPLPKVDNVTPEVGKNGASTFDDIPGFGNIPSTVNVNVNGSPVKAEPETPSMGGKLNLSEYLPSSKPVSSGSVEPPASIATPTPRTSSYVPRNVSGGSSDYFPPQSQPQPQPVTPAHGAAFVPRVHSSSYIPRQTSISSENGSLSTPGANGYDPSGMTLGLTKSPVDVNVPLPLPVRELPPHPTSSTTPSKVPPTGPKVPPTGPRGLGTPGQSGIGIGSSPVSVNGGFRGGERGRGHPRGLWRGRGGGFRGGWRGS
ncbi:hypothetical protein I302_100960 [Kwoniella bestiolae CBS 10118]|uniref:SET domain-containing protein n=1 Tax=Kwoniella bestiolae CBS 10118 TaxID=1296100 RepID=A0A1B9G6L8_9TREE|nr:hypothetical protein I302_04337 [Kwoniella bestiolae CBS 10118]OCF26651.1 hypothetical protein I302_04337 [Kwoniella bestiolae CBS 10118]